jgi:hypothetical protein
MVRALGERPALFIGWLHQESGSNDDLASRHVEVEAAITYKAGPDMHDRVASAVQVCSADRLDGIVRSTSQASARCVRH